MKTTVRGICHVCKMRVSSCRMTEHFQAFHPEYGFRREFSNGRSAVDGYRYICSICDKNPSGLSGIVRHYHQFHPDKLKPPVVFAEGEPNPYWPIVTQPLINEVKPDEDSISDIFIKGAQVFGELNEEVKALWEENAKLNRELEAYKRKHKDLLDSSNTLAKFVAESQALLARRG